MATKKRTASRAQKRRPKKDSFRLDLLVRAQQKVALQVGNYLVETTSLAARNAYSPTEWLKAYAHMWAKIAHELGSLADEF